MRKSLSIVALLAIAVLATASDSPKISVALVPWTNRSALHECEWLCEAGPELLAVALAKQPHLTVLIRRPEEMQSEKSLGSATGANRAGLVLGGSFWRDGDDLHIEMNAGDRWMDNGSFPADRYTQLVVKLASSFSTALAEGKEIPPVQRPVAPPLAFAAMVGRARTALASGHAAEALPDLLRVVRGNPGSGPAWSELAGALDALGLSGAAEAARERAGACGGEDPLAVERLRILAENTVKRDPIAARRLFQRLAVEYPNAEHIWAVGWDCRAEPIPSYVARWLETLPQEAP